MSLYRTTNVNLVQFCVGIHLVWRNSREKAMICVHWLYVYFITNLKQYIVWNYNKNYTTDPELPEQNFYDFIFTYTDEDWLTSWCHRVFSHVDVDSRFHQFAHRQEGTGTCARQVCTVAYTSVQGTLFSCSAMDGCPNTMDKCTCCTSLCSWGEGYLCNEHLDTGPQQSSCSCEWDIYILRG